MDPREFKAALASVGLPGASAKVVGLVLKSAAARAKNSSSGSSNSAAPETDAEPGGEPVAAAAALKKAAAKEKAKAGRKQELDYESFAAMLQQQASP